jgi:hypothetical protein
VDIETVCSLLDHEYRRRVLRVLADRSGTATRDDLARRLARDASRPESREQIETSLYHLHLPKLADENAIRYDTGTETVELTEDGERVLQCLDAIEHRLTAT